MNKIIEDIKNHMKKANKFDFYSRSIENSKMDWNHNGNGNIVDKKISKENEIYFFEEISLENGMKLNDKKMWKFEENKISFYHYRNNEYEKIFSFIIENERLEMEKEYECKPDFYFGKLRLENGKIYFKIEILGKNKNEKIEYIYN